MSRRSLTLALAVGLVSLMAVTGVVLAVSLALWGGDGLRFGDRIALIEVDGIIADDKAFLEDIRRFRRDGSVKGFVISINSPGGVVGAAQSLYRELKRVGGEDGLPIVASIGSVGASGGYYVALAADSILALPGSITGSIGVIMEFPQVSGLMDRIGIGMEVVKSSEHKDIGSPFRPLSEADRALLGALVTDVYEQFVAVVVDERGLASETVRALADGRVISGRQAVEQGLIDRIGNLHDAITMAGRMAGLGDDPRVVRPPEDRLSLFDILTAQGATTALKRILAQWREPRGVRLDYVVPY